MPRRKHKPRPPRAPTPPRPARQARLATLATRSRQVSLHAWKGDDRGERHAGAWHAHGSAASPLSLAPPTSSSGNSRPSQDSPRLIFVFLGSHPCDAIASVRNTALLHCSAHPCDRQRIDDPGRALTTSYPVHDHRDLHSPSSSPSSSPPLTHQASSSPSLPARSLSQLPSHSPPRLRARPRSPRPPPSRAPTAAPTPMSTTPRNR